MKINACKSGGERSAEPGDFWLDIVARQVATLRFGVVQIVVHESRVVQIERTEKVRLAALSAPSDGPQNFTDQKSGG